MNHCCDEMKNHLDKVKINYSPNFREYGIDYEDGISQQVIDYCPWCGSKLPERLRDKWFDIIWDELNLDGPEDPKLPDEFKSDQWWKKRNL